MKKRDLPFHIIMTAVCGWVIQKSYELSGGAAWSLVISTVNASPLETVKPYALVFIMWTFVELSCMRPHLLHYVSARIIALIGFTAVTVLLLRFTGKYISSEALKTAMVFCTLILAETAEYFLYKSRLRTEIFFVPLMTGFAVLFAVLLFCSFYPPEWYVSRIF